MAVNGCCTEWEQEIVLFHDDELSEAGAERVRKHIARCAACSAFSSDFIRSESLLAGSVRGMTEPFTPDDAFAGGVMAALEDRSPDTIWTRLQAWLYDQAVVTYVRTRPHMAVAISLLICLAGALFAAQVGDVADGRTLSLQRSGKIQQITLLEPIFIARPEGEYFELPDGSILFASQGSWFSVESFQEGGGDASVGNDRRISLKSGELFIDVRKAKEAFCIVTANAETTVFGTQFYVGVSLQGDRRTTVAVREGRVMVEKHGRNQTGSTMLAAQEQTIVSTHGGRILLRPPETIEADLLARLDRFYDARNDRSMRQDPALSPAVKDGSLLLESLEN